MSFKTPLKKARGLGSAKSGLAHWRAQRVTAIALVPLSVWFLASLLALGVQDYERLIEWVSSPITAGLLLALVYALAYHALLGVQVVIEDYVSRYKLRHAAILIAKGFVILLGLYAVLAILVILTQF